MQKLKQWRRCLPYCHNIRLACTQYLKLCWVCFLWAHWFSFDSATQQFFNLKEVYRCTSLDRLVLCVTCFCDYIERRGQKHLRVKWSIFEKFLVIVEETLIIFLLCWIFTYPVAFITQVIWLVFELVLRWKVSVCVIFNRGMCTFNSYLVNSWPIFNELYIIVNVHAFWLNSVFYLYRWVGFSGIILKGRCWL